MASTFTRSGRLGDPSMTLASDRRTHPNLLRELQARALDQGVPLELDSLRPDDLKPTIASQHAGLEELYYNVPLELPSDADEAEVLQSTEVMKAFDGIEMKLHLFRRADLAHEKLPAVLYIHGGGMVISSAYNPVTTRWATSLAVAGVLVVMVDFRNAYSDQQYSPYPAGLNDCAAALKHVFANKETYNIDKIVLQGESGGGNLALALALKAKRDGFLDHVDGVFACIPFISNGYLWTEERKLRELPSLVECDSYMFHHTYTGSLGAYYGAKPEDPHAWPYHASIEDVRGLPPHMLLMDELDTLRDEGIAYHHKLLKADVRSTGKVNLGITHGAAFIFRNALPDIYNASIREVAAFAKSL